MNDEPLAILYIRRAGRSYRVKVFERHVWMEQQPGGANVPFDTVDGGENSSTARAVYDGTTWDLDALARLIGLYEQTA